MLNETWYEIINDRIKFTSLPSFIILGGSRGAGKTFTLKHIVKNAQKEGFNVRFAEDNKVDTVRDIITSSYSTKSKSIYMFDDADDMSVGAKNALLKVTEEPPNNATFIMTVSDISNTLETLKSRAEIWNIPIHPRTQLYNWCVEELGVSAEDAKQITSICNTPGECELLKDNIKDFTSYVELVYNNIHTCTGANSFRIGSKIDLDGKGGYDLDLFFRGFECRCMKDFNTDAQRCSYGVQIVAHYRQDLRIKGINKQMLFDNFILDIRNKWR